MNWRPIDSRKLGQAASVRAQTFMAEEGLPGAAGALAVGLMTLKLFI